MTQRCSKLEFEASLASQTKLESTCVLGNSDLRRCHGSGFSFHVKHRCLSCVCAFVVMVVATLTMGPFWPGLNQLFQQPAVSCRGYVPACSKAARKHATCQNLPRKRCPLRRYRIFGGPVSSSIGCSCSRHVVHKPTNLAHLNCINSCSRKT